MSYTFDDGDAVALDTRLQAAILSLLSELVYQEGDAATPRGPYLRTLDAISQLPDMEFMEAQRTEYMRRMPGVLVYVGGARRVEDAVSGRRSWFKKELLVVVFGGAAGNAVDGRLDETAKVPRDTRDDPGIRVIRQHVYELLEGARLPVAGVTGSLRVEAYMELETTTDWTAWGLNCSLIVEEPACASDTRAALAIDAIRTLHNVQDEGVIARQKEVLT